jgi:Cell wall-associated hydrolases (invasion-associated proteins)
MRKGAIRVAAFCLAGTISLTGNSIVSNAALTDMPMAGLTVRIDSREEKEANIAQVDVDTPQVKSEYDAVAIAQVDTYVNIRDTANEEGAILGKLYNNSVATILEEENGWYLISSGSVVGYVKSDYFVTGELAEQLAKEVGKRIAEVATTTLYVREYSDADSEVLALVGEGESLRVVGEEEGWYQVTVDSDVVGYVAADYVSVTTEYVEAESVEEEEMRLEREAADLQAALDEARLADELAQQAADSQAENFIDYIEEESQAPQISDSAAVEINDYDYVPQTEAPVEVAPQAPATPAPVETPPVVNMGTREAIIQYSMQFLGNPYVWGGTSLTNGADCSGFTYSLFGQFGISLPRVAEAQAYSGGGRQVPLDQIQPGDLLFYGSASYIGHVAMYIGNGQIIHASDETTGIIISSYNYRQPVCAVNYID